MKTRWFRRTLALALMVCTLAPATVRAQPCDSTLASQRLREAKRSYENMRTSAAINLLEPCLKVFGDKEKTQALRLLALSYFVRNEPEVADTTVRYLMKKVDPHFRANTAQDPIFFQDLVKKYRQPWYKKTWVKRAAFGGAVVIGSVLGYALLDKKSPLPGPPLFPTGN